MPPHFCNARSLACGLMLVLGASGVSSSGVRAMQQGLDPATRLRAVDVKEPDGQILSYRHLAGSTEVEMRGTALAPKAAVRLKVGSRPGFVELDINRGGITGLKPAHSLGKDFLTYVLWAVSVDGKASNLGEITFAGEHPIPVNVTTPYQTFWLMITAEPSYAVVDPSSQVVLYSVKQPLVSENKALPIKGPLFYFTHYMAYESATGSALEAVPNQLLQARKAVELATKSGVPMSSGSGAALKETEGSREALGQATAFLTRAEEAHRRNPKDQAVIQFARTAAQSAENARALAMGAVGGLLINNLADEIERLRRELAKQKASDAGPGPAPSGPLDAALPRHDPAPLTPAPVATPLVKQPALWFAVAGWVLALVLLFRRRPT